jgi:Na+/H+ antiporter NhaD/arsenite permease-like protein
MTLDAAVPLAIFALTYFVIAVGEVPWLRVDRTGAAVVGGVAMVVSGVLSRRQAINAVDFPTLALLLGMMLIVANLRLSGAFTLVARTLLSRARSGFGLLAMTVAASGVLAAFFINDVVCLALAPLLIESTQALQADPVPFLLALATASNIGSAATITGNPQNMIVAGFAHLDYASFAAHLAPVAIIGLVIDYAIIATVYRHELHRVSENCSAPLPPRPRTHVLQGLLIKSSAVALGALVLFMLGLPTDFVALGAGALLLLTRRMKPQRVYRLIDWTMLLMFAGLFVVVAGAERTGLEKVLVGIVGARHLANTTVLAVAAAVLSNLVSNVPAVLLFKPLYPTIGYSHTVGMVLASASTLAGNLTVVGSIANLIVIEQARSRKIAISFGDYLRVGVPITILTLAVDLVALNLLR